MSVLQVLSFGATGALVVSLFLPRLWLHAVGVAACTMLFAYAVSLGDAVFIVTQALFVVANGVGLVSTWNAFARYRACNFSESEKDWWK